LTGRSWKGRFGGPFAFRRLVLLGRGLQHRIGEAAVQPAQRLAVLVAPGEPARDFADAVPDVRQAFAELKVEFEQIGASSRTPA
jgi:hypothetical protein